MCILCIYIYIHIHTEFRIVQVFGGAIRYSGVDSLGFRALACRFQEHKSIVSIPDRTHYIAGAGAAASAATKWLWHLASKVAGTNHPKGPCAQTVYTLA